MNSSLFNPEFYRGQLKRNFFEGWYYKIVDKKNEHSIVFIPGYLKEKAALNNHSFMQVLIGKTAKTHYLRFGIDSFHLNHESYEITIDKNRFSLRDAYLNYYDQQLHIIGHLSFYDLVSLPKRKLLPVSIGELSLLPLLDSHTQVLCLNGKVDGKVYISNEEVDFSNGKIYIGKLWGKHFPSPYLWLQGNSFEAAETAFACTLATYRKFRMTKTKLFATVVHENNYYEFSIRNRTQYFIKQDQNQLMLTLKNEDYQLQVSCALDDETFIICHRPHKNILESGAQTNIVVPIRIELYDLLKERIIFSGLSQMGGIELIGDINQL